MNNLVQNEYKQASVQTFCADLKKIKPLKQDDIKKLIPKAKEKDKEATNKILESNLRYVFKVANGLKGNGVPILDLVSEGNLGILKAIDKFDVTKGYSFLTYANSWIKAFMLIKIREENKKRELVSLNAYNENYRMDDNHNEMDEPIDISEMVISDDNDTMIDADTKEYVDSLMVYLTDKEKQVIHMAFGFDGEKPMTMEEISSVIGGSSERARQIKDRALKKLRCHALKDSRFFEMFK